VCSGEIQEGSVKRKESSFVSAGCFEYANQRFSVRSFDQVSLSWLNEFLCPAFQPVDNGPADWTILVEDDPAFYNKYITQPPHNPPELLDCFTLDGSFSSHEVLQRQDTTVIVRDQKRGIIYKIDAEQSRISIVGLANRRIQRMSVARVIRELATVHCLNSGQLHCHRAAFEINGKAIVLAGVKRAGKTSNLIHATHDPAAQFISNDRLFLQTDCDEPVVRGMPTIFKVRPKTLELLPDFGKRWRVRPYHFLETLGEAEYTFSERRKNLFEKPDVDARLSTAQFCELRNTSAICTAKLGAIVFPVISPHTQRENVEPLRPDVASRKLFNDSLLKASSPQQTARAFRRSDELSIISDDYVKSQCDLITSQVPCFRFTVGPDIYQRPYLLPALLRSAA